MHGARVPPLRSCHGGAGLCARDRSISSELTDVDQTEQTVDARQQISADTDRIGKIKLNSMGSRAARAFHLVSVCVSRVRGAERNV